MRFLFTTFFVLLSCNNKRSTAIEQPSYPAAPSKVISETYFGTTIVDDYRNLEKMNDSLVGLTLPKGRICPRNFLQRFNSLGLTKK